MALAKIEFALGEFAAFEFANELVTAVAEASFHGAGAAVVVPDSFAYANSEATITGGSLFDPDLVGVNNTLLEAPSGSDSTWEGQPLLISGFGFGAASAAAFDSADLQQAVFGVEGTSLAEFDYLDGPGFDIKTTSATFFATQVISDHVFGVDSTSGVAFDGNAYGMSTTQIDGVSSFTTQVNNWYQARFNAVGESAAQGTAQAYVNRTLETSGTGGMAGVGGATSNTKATSAGGSVVDMKVSPLVRVYSAWAAQGTAGSDLLMNPLFYKPAVYNAPGAAQVFINAQALRDSAFNMAGGSQAQWWRGRQVLPSMPVAFDVVERPAEDRRVERPAETRVEEWSE